MNDRLIIKLYNNVGFNTHRTSGFGLYADLDSMLAVCADLRYLLQSNSIQLTPLHGLLQQMCGPLLMEEKIGYRVPWMYLKFLALPSEHPIGPDDLHGYPRILYGEILCTTDIFCRMRVLLQTE